MRNSLSSLIGSNLGIQISRCVGLPYCKSDEEFEKFVEYNTLAIYTSGSNYKPSQYGDNTVKSTIEE